MSGRPAGHAGAADLFRARTAECAWRPRHQAAAARRAAAARPGQQPVHGVRAAVLWVGDEAWWYVPLPLVILQPCTGLLPAQRTNPAIACHFNFCSIIDDLFQSQPPPQVPTDMLFSMAAVSSVGMLVFWVCGMPCTSTYALCTHVCMQRY